MSYKSYCGILPIWPNSYRGRTSYRKISESLEAVRFGLKIFQSFWTMTATYLDSSASEMPVKFQNDTISMISKLATSRLNDMW